MEPIEPDFSGWATKAGIKCSDGRTIMPDAFKHQDSIRVPLVWQHGHNSPENVLGHAILENRKDGVYTYAFFNDTPAAKHAKELVDHQDINSLSIWANQLREHGKMVLHGVIREVSLVLSGANPGALIDNIRISHGVDDDDMEELADEAIITMGLELEHDSLSVDEDGDDDDDSSDDGDDDDDSSDAGVSHAATDPNAPADGPTIQDIYDSMNEEQQAVLQFMVGEALASVDPSMAQSSMDDPDASIEEVYSAMNEAQQAVVHFFVGEALDSAAHSDIDENDSKTNAESGKKGEDEMKHSSNVFDKDAEGESKKGTLSHDAMELFHSSTESIFADAVHMGSLRKSVESYAFAHGIDNIDLLFPDAKLVTEEPEFNKRRTEWVSRVLDGVKKSPFARIKTRSADLTYEDARAKGYVKGSLKREEYIPIATRTTTPTTVYKKQKLDRDDVVDITDFDLIMWLKAEMRLMLDEECARAILVGDGRDIAHDDKINEQNVRPIASDNELFTSTVWVNISDSGSSVSEISDAIISNRKLYKGTGLPVFFTTETYISMFMVLKDTTGRRIYSSLQELATELRVSEIIAVEVMEEDAYSDIVGIMVNPIDYSVGTDKGGEVTMFDDFDLDYNKMIYLLETRMSGALTKLKSAIVVKVTTDTLIQPLAPDFDSASGVVTINAQTGVVYKNAANSTITGAQSAIAAGATVIVHAVPDTGYQFFNSHDDTWAFTRQP